jgi:uncharacterized protein
MLSAVVQFQPYLQAWQRRQARQREDDEVAAQRAMSLARDLARLLVEQYGATRVVLVGSLARGEFKSGSDIDLAVEGIAPEAFFAASAEIERVARWVSVDLVPLESARALFRDEVARRGVVLA